jgi:4-amino-4-deoxy-L-arabinose transferase-like glycosyltransferase
MLAYRVFGVRLGGTVAVTASFMVLSVYFFLRRLRPGLHLDGALITASAAGIVGFAHAASPDMPLAAMFTFAMLAWYSWWETSQRSYLAAFYGFLALATLAKGPVAPVLGAVIVVLFAIAAKRARIILNTLWIPGMLLFFQLLFRGISRCRFAIRSSFACSSSSWLRAFREQPVSPQTAAWFYLPVALLHCCPDGGDGYRLCGNRASLVVGTHGVVDDTGDASTCSSFFGLRCRYCSFLSQSKLPGYTAPPRARYW